MRGTVADIAERIENGSFNTIEVTSIAVGAWLALGQPKDIGIDLIDYALCGDMNAAMKLVLPNLPNGMRCRVILERKPTQDADWWTAEVRYHAQDGGAAVSKSPAHALVAACLRARAA